MNNICIDCKGETINISDFGSFSEKGVIYVRRGKENVEICLSCWQKTRI